MIRLAVLLIAGGYGQYTRLADDQVGFTMNGYVDMLFPWVGPGYDQGGSDWGGVCATGQNQSPIDIDETPDDPALFQVVTVDNSTFTPITFNSVPGSVEVFFDGYLDVYFIYSGTLRQQVNSIRVNQILGMLTFNTPAEHTINGYRYPMNVVLGYAGANANAAITFGYQVVVNVREGAANPALDQFINQQPFDTSSLLPPNGVLDDYYFYMGSFSNPEPDCLENVAWVVSNYVVEASREQIAYFEDLYINDPSFSGGAGNARAIQPQNGRTVYHFIPTPSDDLSSFLE